MEDYATISEDANDICFEDDYDDMFFRDDFDISVEDDYNVHKELVHFVDQKMPISTIDTDKIEKARRFMFAEYLVSYLVFQFHGLVYNTRLNKESEFLLYPFFEPIRDAARIIRRQINDAHPLSFEIIGDLSKSHKLCYEIFVDAVLSHYSEKGLQAGQFLYFSVYFSELAAKCYRTDFEEVLDSAVYAILDAFCIYKGRKSEFIDFADSLAHKSDQTDEESLVEILGINFEKLKVVNKCDKCKVMNNLQKLSINENIGNNQENGLEECRAALEQLNLVDKWDKHEIIGNFEFSMDEIVEKMINSVEFHVNNCNLPFCSRDRCISLIDKVYNREYKKVPRPPENKFFDDILQEVLTVVNLEASLFSAIYGSSKNQQSLESQDDNNSINTKNKIESSTCSSFQNIKVQNSHLFQELVPHDCTEKNVETSINASITPNLIIAEREKAVESASPDNTLEHADLKFSIDELNAFELEQNQFVQRSSDNKVRNLTAEFDMNFAQKDIEQNSESNCDIVDNNGIKEECNFIEEETKILKEANVIFTSGFKQEDDEKTLQGFGDNQEYGKLNFRNTEVKELDTIEPPLICENPSENNKLEENFTQVESKNNENVDCLFDNNFVLPLGTEDKQTVDIFAIYKSEGEIGEENLKVLKGDTILFAEDLVRYTVKEFYDISYSETKFNEIRSLSCNNAFDETVKKLLNFTHDKSETLNRIIFDVLANVKEHNIECYRKYVVTVLSHFVEDGLNSNAFLYFCLHFTELAAKFYVLDHPEMLDSAICSILDAFCLLKDDWSEFKVATERVLEIFKAKTDYQCTGCKINSVVDNFEKECINTILDTLKTFLDEKIKEVVSNNFETAEDVKNRDLSPKISEKIDKDESYETEVITNEKSTQT